MADTENPEMEEPAAEPAESERTKAEERDPKFWIGGIAGEAFAARPILTICSVLGFLGGAVLGAKWGLTAGGALWFAIGAIAGGAGGVIAILILWLILMAIGLAG